MSDPNTWNPEDGPPPTEEELLDAQRLAASLDGSVAPRAGSDSPAASESLDVALRVRAIYHPDAELAAAAARRAVERALALRPQQRWWTRGPRLHLVAAAAAITLITGAIGGARILRGRASRPLASPSALLWESAVEPGAGSAPAAHMYEHGLRDYRAALLGEAR